MIKCTVTIENKLGLHARAATKLARVASRYNSSAQVYKDNKSADAKSIISLLMLEAPFDSPGVSPLKAPFCTTRTPVSR